MLTIRPVPPMSDMSLTFECPQCGRFCAAGENLAGKTAQCNNCGCKFFIPQTQGQKPVPVQQVAAEPPGGFYRAALIGNWASLFGLESLVGLLFCIAMTVVQFIAGNTDYSFTMGAFRAPLALGWVVHILSFGSLFWYFFQVIAAASTEQETLPDFDIGFGFEFFGNVIKSLFFFLNAILIAFLPPAAIGALLESGGWNNPVISIALFLVGCFLIPIELGILACELPMWTVFRFDLILRMIVKTIRSYLVTTGVVFAGFGAYFLTLGLFATEPGITKFGLWFYPAARVAAMILMLFSLRVIGLYCRYYSQTAPWLWARNPSD